MLRYYGLRQVPQELLELKSLQCLDLSFNPLEGNSVSSLSALGALCQLGLPFTNLLEVPEAMLASGRLEVRSAGVCMLPC